MIKLQNIALSFGEQAVFDRISTMIQPYEKIGLVGPNGAGKSTLLKAIAGRQKLDGGKIVLSNGFRLAYLPQEVVLVSELSIFDETMQAYGELGQWHVREKELEAAGEQGCAEYVHIHADLAEHDHGAKCAQARRVLTGLGIEQEKHGDPVSSLSVGWRMRVVLAKLLLQDADMYLFDEPTNHLDLPAREWLCSFLRSASTGYLLISHDRYVLDEVSDKTIVLGRGRLREYDGNYSYYRRTYDEQVELQRAAKAAQDREISQKKKTIQKFRAKASKAKMAQSMIKQLARVERITVDEEALPSIALPFPPMERTGRIVIQAEHLAKAFGDKKVFANASFEIERGQRVAIIAPNGAGKTTLLSCLHGGLVPDAGTVVLGHNVKAAVFEQEQVGALNPQRTVHEEVDKAASAAMSAKVRSVLGALLFSGNTVKKTIKVLSGGERNRVALAKVLVTDANLLLLDEPTNHLDLLTKQMLTEALARYEGTLLFVSHDRDIVEKVATAIISIDHGEVSYYPGTYASFVYAREQAEASQTQPQKKDQRVASQSAGKQKTGTGGGDRKQLQRIERDIARHEAQEQKLAMQLGEYEYGTPEYDKALALYEKASDLLKESQTEWENAYGAKD